MRTANAPKQMVLILACALALVPTIFMVLTALKSQDDFSTNKIGLPQAFVLEHFRAVLFDSPLLLWMLNSGLLVTGAVALSMVVACLAAYAIARMRFAGRDLIFTLSTSLMAVPPVVLIVPLFVLYTRLVLISTFAGAILTYAGLFTPFSV
jgi:multiple sugar transport system permease protein